MTTRTILRPFIARVAVPLEPGAFEKVRYDEQRQVSLIFVKGAWVDATTAPRASISATRMTKVARETTDDA